MTARALRRMPVVARFLERDSGGAILELAIAIPVLLLLALGVAGYARVYYTGITVASASRAGAQFGSFANPPGDSVSMRVSAQNDAGTMTLDTVTSGRFCTCEDGTSVACAGSCGAYGAPRAYDSVRVVKMVPLLFSYLGLPTTVKVARTPIMRPQ
jgi:Flp pilus assembly protein TadG